MRIAALEAFGLDDCVLDVWKSAGHDRLLPVQEMAIRQGKVLDGQNVVVFSPTSSGKTFVGEMAAIRMARQNKRVVYLVPQKALAEEKYREFVYPGTSYLVYPGTSYLIGLGYLYLVYPGTSYLIGLGYLYLGTPNWPWLLDPGTPGGVFSSNPCWPPVGMTCFLRGFFCVWLHSREKTRRLLSLQ